MLGCFALLSGRHTLACAQLGSNAEPNPSPYPKSS